MATRTPSDGNDPRPRPRPGAGRGGRAGRRLIGRVVLATSSALVVLGACSGNSGPEILSAPDPTTPRATTTTALLVNPDLQAAITAGSAVDYWLTERFYPGGELDREARGCVIKGILARLTPAEVEAIAFLDPSAATPGTLALVRRIVPVFDICIDKAAFNVLAATSFAALGEYEPICATSILTSTFTVGASLLVFFSTAGTSEEPAAFVDLRTMMKNVCALDEPKGLFGVGT
jgi:hypothetical protein